MRRADWGLDEATLLEEVAAVYTEAVDVVPYDFRVEATRRDFLQVLGAGLVLAVTVEAAKGQQVPAENRRGARNNRGAATIAARIHIGADGVITVLTGKVECGQGSRAELTQAAAEELRVPVGRVRLVMGDTALVPDDGGTYGSLTTPSTVPALRRGCAAARDLLAGLASRRFGGSKGDYPVIDGAIGGPEGQAVTYADLAADETAARAFAAALPSDIALTPVDRFEILGQPLARPNRLSILDGSHQYPSDIVRPGMLYGKVLRPASYGAKLTALDLGPAREVEGAIVVRDGEFVGVAAPTTWAAQEALESLTDSAEWQPAPHPSSAELADHLRHQTRDDPPANPFDAEQAHAATTCKQTYQVAYIQHAPMEPRAAVAEWGTDGTLTVWTGTQVPYGVRNELARAFGMDADRVRVIVPDFGGGFGGKHSGECAVEAARLAKAAGKPVKLVWTRAEEFTWAQFRPAAVIDVAATLDEAGKLTSWYFVNINSGAAEVQTPYRVARNLCKYVACDPPLRHGSYRGLAATANHFARESFMDELAELAGSDPLDFRLRHLDNPRIKAVLQAVAERANWAGRGRKNEPNVGFGLAAGTDKGSVVVACAEVEVHPDKGEIVVRRVTQAFECGKILNPTGLLTQVEGAIIQGIGPALREGMEFTGGQITNATFRRYKVPRFADLPELDIILLDRPDLASAGAGETPLIAVAPAIANAVRAATGQRIRQMPIRLAAAPPAKAKANA